VNTVSFPVTYNEGFYQDVVKRNNEHLNKFAYYNGFVVGAVCTRIEPLKSDNSHNFPPHATATISSDMMTSGGSSNSNSPTDNLENETPNNNNMSNTSNNTGQHRLYIMTLAVLAAYRGRGIGAQLIQSVIDYCESINDGNPTDDKLKHDASLPKRVDEIALHVHISNDDAIRFYTSKFGFEKGEMVENYYRRIDPPHCYILSKKF
jgi:N-alpha-acetyltransferase 50